MRQGNWRRGGARGAIWVSKFNSARERASKTTRTGDRRSERERDRASERLRGKCRSTKGLAICQWPCSASHRQKYYTRTATRRSDVHQRWWANIGVDMVLDGTR